MDFCIALMLLIFTVGIGLILYYYAREKNRCVHCDSLCQFQLPEGQKEILSNGTIEIKGRTVLHCPYCGAKVNNKNMASCPSCGSQI
jgi:rubrerythrin